MAPRSTSSSPDPLALSYDENAYSPAKGYRRISAAALSRLSANVQTPPRSPNKEEATSVRSVRSVTMLTPSREGGSPMKIRVTVEAEPDETRSIRSKPAAVQTRIITVPTKENDGNSPLKRRGRPRKSSGGESVENGWNKLDLTPMKRSNTRKAQSDFHELLQRTQDAATSEAAALNSDDGNNSGDSASSKKRGRSKSSGAGSPMRSTKKQPTAKKSAAAGPTFAEYTPLHKKTRSARKSEIALESESFDSTEKVLKPNKPRKATPIKPTESQSHGPTQATPSSPKAPEQDDEVEMWKSMVHHNEDISDTHDSQHQPVDEYADDGNFCFTSNNEFPGPGLEDDTSVLDRSALESEGFSMISIDSLRNQQAVPTAEGKKYEGFNAREMQESSSKVISQTDQRQPCISRQITPVSEPISPPQLPPIPRPSPKKACPVRISPTATAGAALQNLIEVIPKSTRPFATCEQNNKDENTTPATHNIFQDFGSGTRRDLRAGFMMGELLSRGTEARLEKPTNRRSSFHRLPTPTDSEASAEHTEIDQLEKPGKMSLSKSTVQEVQDTDKMSWKPTYAVPQVEFKTTEVERLQLQHDQWQREREAVILEANAASPSNIITIESSILQPKEDIWQEEADRSFEEASQVQEENMESVEESQMEDLYGPELRPWRGKIPSPWRKHENSALIYSDEVEESHEQSSFEHTNTAGSQENGGYEASESVSDENTGIYDSSDQSEVIEDGEDTGLVWQKNLPNEFDARRSRLSDEKRVDLSSLLNAPNPLISSPVKEHAPDLKGILSSPARSSPARDSPLKVRFGEVKHRLPESVDTTLLSEESEAADASLPSEQSSGVHETGYDERAESSSVDSESRDSREESTAESLAEAEETEDEEQSNLSLSDVRQLKLELTAMSTPHQKTLKFLNLYEDPSFIYRSADDITTSILAPKHEYASLFGTKSPAGATKPSPPATAGPSLLTRLTSFFQSTPSHKAAYPATPAWTLAHYALLNRIWRSSPVAPTPAPDNLPARRRATISAKLPFAYPEPLPGSLMLTPTLKALVGTRMCTDEMPEGVELSEGMMAVAVVFCDEVESNGVVLDGASAAVTECWKGEEGEKAVAVRVFSLVAGEEMRRRVWEAEVESPGSL